MKKRIYQTILLQIFIVGQLYAQDDTWIHYSSDNTGLPSNAIKDITLDPNGDLWIATFPNHSHSGPSGGGVVKFNGEIWKVYNNENSSLHDNVIQTIAVDSLNHVWIGHSFEGVSSFDGDFWSYDVLAAPGVWLREVMDIYVNESNVKWFAGSRDLIRLEDSTWAYLNPPIPSGTNGGFTSVQGDAEGNIWFAADFLLFKFDGVEWTLFSRDSSDLPIAQIKSMIIDQQGKIWLASRAYGIISYDNEQWATFDINNNPDNNDRVNAIGMSSDGLIWVGTEVQLFTFDGTNWEEINLGFESGLTNNSVSTILSNENGEVYFGTPNGLATFDGNDWKSFTTANTGLPRYAYRMVIDNDNNKWIASAEAIVKFDGEKWTVYNNENSPLGIHQIKSILIGPDGSKWIGKHRRGLIKYDDESWVVYDTSNSNIPHNNVRSMVFDLIGNIWLATDKGIARFDGINWSVYDTSNSDLPSDFINSIDIDQNEAIWVCSGNDVVKYDGVEWTVFNNQNSELPNGRCDFLYIDQQNNVWISINSSGLAKYDGFTWEVFDTLNSPIPSNNIHYITSDIDDKLWIGTEPDWDGSKYIGGGLASYDGISWSLLNSSVSELPNDNVFFITFDEYDNIWIGTEYGLSVYNENGIVSAKEEKNYIILKTENLKQNYPNPFNPVTNISYSIPRDSKVSLIIYNLRGQKVAQLVNSNERAGNYKVTWNASDVSSGIYFYRLQAGDYIKTRKMVYLK
ncbi:MAG: T9SS type A sorting domain-containing protein [Candidatus Marinimicrobia bacterium]|nr:T9SS type A sorting domain-containing protein [Candidatus Neomarinimicrobiota bacterium]